MFVCEECGAAFVEPELAYFYRERFPVCPECGSLTITDFTTQCSECGEWRPDDDIIWPTHICKSCMDVIIDSRRDLVLAYLMEDFGAWAEFADEKIQEEKSRHGVEGLRDGKMKNS